MTDTNTAAPFIVLEGIDGAGTTTQAHKLAARWRAAGRTPVVTNEPTEGPIGTLIRQMLSMRVVLQHDPPEPVTRETLALLFAADRLDHVAATIEPAIAAGKPVISDRYYHSSLAYQGDVGVEGDEEVVDYEWVWSLNSRARTPDVTFFLEIDVETSLERIGTRSRRDIYETREKLARLVRRYKEVMKTLEREGEPIVYLDGTRPIEVLHEEIWHRVSRL